MNSEIEIVVPASLNNAETLACLQVLENGDAVDIEYAKQELPRCTVVALAKEGGTIVALGAVKRQRPEYAADKATKAGFEFDSRTHEVGYIAVANSHRGRHLSRDILQILLTKFAIRPLFATTSNERMKATLSFSGFAQQGKDWKGPRGNWISLWIKSD
jgi:hypothetical protein